MSDNIENANSPEMDPASKEIMDSLEVMQTLLKYPDVRKQLVRNLVSTGEVKERGKAEGKFYYNERDAKALLPIIDDMIERKVDKEFKYKTYAHWSKHTLKARLSQGIEWLADHSKEIAGDDRYTKFRLQTKVSFKEYGIRVQFRTEVRLSSDMLGNTKMEADDVTYKHSDPLEEVDAQSWRKAVFDFLDTTKVGDYIEIADIVLTKDDIDWLQNIIGNDPRFDLDVTEYSLKITDKGNKNE